jgi:hypothetical protein
MSQFIVFNPTGSGGMGPVLTLTGNTGGAISPTVGGNINVVGDATTINIAGNAGTNTLTASVFGTQVDTAQTTDGSTINCGTVTVANNEVVIAQSRIIGAYETATDEAIGCVLTATFRKQGAAAVALVQAVEQTALAKSVGVPGTVTATYDTSGAAVRIRVTGEAAHTINWKAVTTVSRQTAP